MSDYDSELVERLLPTLWDESYAYGMTSPEETDPDMPRAATAKNQACTLWAHMADISAAWKHTPLVHEVRVALLCRYGLDWTQSEIGRELGVSQSTVSRLIDTGNQLLVAWLNADKCKFDNNEEEPPSLRP